MWTLPFTQVVQGIEIINIIIKMFLFWFLHYCITSSKTILPPQGSERVFVFSPSGEFRHAEVRIVDVVDGVDGVGDVDVLCHWGRDVVIFMYQYCHDDLIMFFVIRFTR